jgi:hypothetical protein
MTLSLARRRTSARSELTGHAYMLVEEARLRCEVLREGLPCTARWQRLRELHRELGLAGLAASEMIFPVARQALLDQAHRRSAGAGTAAGDWRALMQLMRHALRVMDRAFVASGAAEDITVAQWHLVSALELVDMEPGPAERVRRPRPARRRIGFTLSFLRRSPVRLV